MKNSEVINLNRAIGMVGNLKGVKFAYGVAKNASKIASEVKLINKAEPEEYKKFVEERTELVEKSAKKDANGMPVISGNNYVMEDTNKFNAEIEGLKQKHQSAIDEYDKWMDTENELKFHMINIDDVPTDITVQQMVTIECMILDPEIDPDNKSKVEVGKPVRVK